MAGPPPEAGSRREPKSAGPGSTAAEQAAWWEREGDRHARSRRGTPGIYPTLGYSREPMDFLRSCSNSPHTQWLRTPCIYYLIDLGVRSPKRACLMGRNQGVAGLVPSGGSRGEPVSWPPPESGGACIPWLVATSPQPPLPSSQL